MTHKDFTGGGDPRRSLGLLWGRQETGRRGPKPQEIARNNGLPGAPTVVSNPVEYPIFTQDGRPVATQRFQSQREAQDFIDELNRFRMAQEQLRRGNGPILIPSERF